MRVIIHDLSPEDWQKIAVHAQADDVVIYNQGNFHSCSGCFGCWTKTPGTCVIRDGYHELGALLGQSDRLLLISRNCYGSYSPFVKAMIDRGIGYILPYFQKRNGEMHHAPRYANSLSLHAIFYGEEQTEEERLTARELLARQAINLFAGEVRLDFPRSLAELSL